MADERMSDNIILINAPAGSGKTYRIKEEIRRYILENPKDKILCITYTNRAAEELLRDIDSENVYISTIHAYINALMSSLYSKKEIVSLYFEFYENDILGNLSDPAKETTKEKCADKFGVAPDDLTLEVVKENVRNIFYTETQFDSLYYGGLSHDKLLEFSFKVFDRFPKLYQRINRKYKRIIIDEYQDTSPEVFKIFFRAVRDTDVKLFLYGDRMQQIYKLYDEDFNNTLLQLEHDEGKIVNHRSIPVIVDILNKLYNNEDLVQEYYDALREVAPEHNPQILLRGSNEFDTVIDELTQQDQNTLTLYIFNSQRFERIGAANLFKMYGKIPKYGHGNRYTAKDVLLTWGEKDNPDDLMKMLIIMLKSKRLWCEHNYGSFLQLCRSHKTIFDNKYLKLNCTEDKNTLKTIWTDVFSLFDSDESTIGDLVRLLVVKSLLTSKYVDMIYEEQLYDGVMKVSLSELKALEKSISFANVSTQHGVKGESHDSVVFVAEDSKIEPMAHMYAFFKLWSLTEFSLNQFEDFCLKYAAFCKQVESDLGTKISEIKQPIHESKKESLLGKCREILERFREYSFFDLSFKEAYENYIAKQTIANLKKCFRGKDAIAILNAYKLFYVGCSRARKNLTILVDENKIHDFKDAFVKRAEHVGFEVVDN